MEWKQLNEEVDEEILEEEVPVEAVDVTDRSGYVAVVGISFDKFGARVEAGDSIPSEYLQEDQIFNWLKTKKGAIKLKR